MIGGNGWVQIPGSDPSRVRLALLGAAASADVDFDLHLFTPFNFCYRREGGTPQTRMQKTSASSETDRSTRGAVRIGSYRDRHHFSYGRRRDRVSAMEMRARGTAHREARRRSDRSEAGTTQAQARGGRGGFLARARWTCWPKARNLVLHCITAQFVNLIWLALARPAHGTQNKATRQ
jgi:hypothetical protein